MSESGGFNGGDNIDLQGGSFSRLLLSTHAHAHAHQTSPFFSTNTPNMLCFGDFTSQMSSSFTSHSCTEIPSASSFGNAAITTLDNNNKRRSGSGQETGLGSENGQKNGRKRNKPEMGPTSNTTNATLVGHVKRKKEKLGERISALQQLVCPYGKTDTASVLHEAMGYIRFLQDQVKVLSTPYLQQPLPSSSSPKQPLSAIDKIEPISEKAYDTTKCLRSRGLCLIPVEYIFGVANTNGADFWSYSTSSPGP